MRGLADAQRGEAQHAARLADKSGEAARNDDDAARDEAARDARNASRREQQQAGETESLADRIERIAGELARNPTVETDLLGDLMELSRKARDIAAQSIAEAAEHFGRAAEAPRQDQQGSRPSQQQSLQDAQRSAQEAGERLDQLASQAGRLRTESILTQLAAEAERLAARQLEIRDATVPLAEKTLGRLREQLSGALNRALELVASAEDSVAADVGKLTEDIEKAVQDLAGGSPRDVDKAREAAREIKSAKTGEQALEVADSLRRNRLLISLPTQEAIARTLTEVARILRGPDQDEIERVSREIQEFIVRQKRINAAIEIAIQSSRPNPTPGEIGNEQDLLRRDVAEQATALRWLASQFQMFQSATAERLKAAAGEMRSGALALYDGDKAKGLEHGVRALVLLEEAAEQFQSESEQMQEQGQQQEQELPEFVLLLLRVLAEQKKINRDVALADRARPRSLDRFLDKTLELAERQSGNHVDARRLAKMLESLSPAAVEIVSEAGRVMGVSRLALDSADTGKETRLVGRQVALLLEKLLRDQQGGSGGAASQMRSQMLGQSPGAPGGGFEGGVNDPSVRPDDLDDGSDDSWRKSRLRFKDKLGTGANIEVDPQFRGLLDAYFKRLREEPAR
jgi:hypothetical protein